MFLAVGALVMASCGGGGGSLSAPPATSFRANIPGDSWTYNVHIDFGSLGSFPGSLSVALTNDTYQGVPTVRSTQTFVIDTNNGPSSVVSYAEIGLDGQLLAETQNGILLAVTSNTFSIPGTIGPNTSSSGVTTFSDNETITQTFNVVGTDQISTPSGSYSCWVATQKAVQSTGTTDAFRIWEAPETGNYVRLTDTTTSTNSAGYTYTASLASTVTASQQNRFNIPGLVIRAMAHAIRPPVVR